MPVINLALSDDEHRALQDEYKKMLDGVQRLGRPATPPSFEQWMNMRVRSSRMPDRSESELDDIRTFSAIERLVTSLPQHGFGLAHVAKAGTVPAASALGLAQALVAEFSLQPHYVKRLQDLFEHYMKSGKEIADIAHVGVTNYTFVALTDAYMQLAERTEKALPHLGDQRAIGRVEGALAVLVALEAMDRIEAKKKTDEFKMFARTQPKATWVGKVFGGAGTKE